MNKLILLAGIPALLLTVLLPLVSFAQLGALDATFNTGTGPNGFVRTTALQIDGKIIIGGEFTNYNGTPRNYIAVVEIVNEYGQLVYHNTVKNNNGIITVKMTGYLASGLYMVHCIIEGERITKKNCSQQVLVE